MRMLAALGVLVVIAANSNGGEALNLKRQASVPNVPVITTAPATPGSFELEKTVTTILPNGNLARLDIYPGQIESGRGQKPTVYTTYTSILGPASTVQSSPESPEPTPTQTPTQKKTIPLDADPISEAKSSSGGKSNTAAIVGGVVGGIVVLALMTLAIFWCVFRRKPKQEADRTESALALEKLGSESPESPLDSINPAAYPAPINTSQALPPPPAPPPPPSSQGHSNSSPVSQQRLDREQPLPPIPTPEYHGGGDREDSHLLHHRSQDPDALLPPLPTAPHLPQFASSPVHLMQTSNQSAPPPPPPIEPAELLSREVDNDGVSVRSFELEREAESRAVNRSIPRLPMYQKPSGGGDGLPGQAL